jgi:hypothetical protein
MIDLLYRNVLLHSGISREEPEKFTGKIDSQTVSLSETAIRCDWKELAMYTTYYLRIVMPLI